MKTKVLITGAPGQDAYWLAHLLLKRGYKVTVSYRYSSTPISLRMGDWAPQIERIPLDITDGAAVRSVVAGGYDQIYHLAALSHVARSFEAPATTFRTNTDSVIHFLEAIRTLSPATRFYFAATSEIFGSNWDKDEAGCPVQSVHTARAANSPYGAAKLAAMDLVRIYRESYNLFCLSGVLHNHGSERRGEEFLERKVSKWAAQLAKHLAGEQPEASPMGDWVWNGGGKPFPKLRLGNTEAARDWSHALDMVAGMNLMLEWDEPRDWMLASGEAHSVLEVVEEALRAINIDEDPNLLIRRDPALVRPCEVPFLRGDATPARQELGWTPQRNFRQLIHSLVDYDRKLLEGNPPGWQEMVYLS